MGNFYNFPVTTLFILAEKAIFATCGRECVDWGIALLSKGREEDSVLRLASRVSPYNHFEILRDRDEVLEDLGISHFQKTETIHLYVYELLNAVIENPDNLRNALKVITNFYLLDYDRILNDLYMLDCAFDDLQFENFSYHMPDANRKNIQDIAIEQIREFIANHQHLNIELP